MWQQARHGFAVILLILSFAVIGCSGSRETDVIAYVIAMGIDKSEKEAGQFDFTFQIAVPRSLAAGGQSTKLEESQFFITITAVNLADARNKINTVISRPPTWAHTKIILFGESMARSGIKDFLSPTFRWREFRGSIYLAVVHNGSAKELMEKNRPILEQNLSRWYETVLIYDKEPALYIKTQLHDVYKQLKSDSASPYITLIAFNQQPDTAKDAGKVPPSKSYEFTAGNLIYESKDTKVEIAGTALFFADKMVGILTTDETRALQILKGTLLRSFVIVEDPLVPQKAVNAEIRLDKQPKIQANLVDGEPVFYITVDLEGEITSIPSGINYENEEYSRLLEDRISDVIYRQINNMLVKTQEAGCDAVGFGYKIRRLFWTYPEFQQLGWQRLYPKSKFVINVDTKIRRTGLMLKTNPIADDSQKE